MVTTANLISLEEGVEQITQKYLEESLKQVMEMKQLALKEIGISSTPSEDMFS